LRTPRTNPLRTLALALVAALAALGCSSTEKARELEAEGVSHIQAGRPAEGVRCLEEALEADPGSVQAGMSLAAIYESAGDSARAVRTLEGVVAEKPAVHLARMSLAAHYVRLGRLEEALAQYAVVGRAAQHAQAFLGMADIYELRGESSLAERATIAAIQSEPTNPAPRWRLARLYDSLGRAEARGAYERYLAAGVGNPDEKPRIDIANARLRTLGPTLSPEERAALLATVRRHLATIPVGPSGAFSPAEAAAVATDAGPSALRRFYSGRTHVLLRASGAPVVRGTGSGATLYEGAFAAAEDLRRSRVYDLYFAGALARARVEVYLELGDPAPLTLLVSDAAGAVVPAEGGPFGEDELLEWRAGARTALVLPTDRAAQGLSTLGATIRWAQSESGLTDDDWRKGTLRRARVRGFLEEDPTGGTGAGPRWEGSDVAGGDPGRSREAEAARDAGSGVGLLPPRELDGALPQAPPPERAHALAAARLGASWIASLLGADGALSGGFDPATGAAATPTAVAQAVAIEALSLAGDATDERRFHTAAALGRKWLVQEEFRAGAPGGASPAPGASGVGGTLTAGPTAAPAPELRGAARLAAAIDAAVLDLRARSLPAPAVGAGGKAGTIPAAGAGARAAAERDRAQFQAEKRLKDLVQEALGLSIDPCASVLYAEPRRALGAFREGRLDPRITLQGTSRLVVALLNAAPLLAAPGGAAPSRS